MKIFRSEQGGGKERKKKKIPHQQHWIFIPRGKPAKQLGFSLISNQAEHLQLHTAFLCCSKKSPTRPSACHTVTDHPVGGFTASCIHQEFPALVYSSFQLLERHQPCKPTLWLGNWYRWLVTSDTVSYCSFSKPKGRQRRMDSKWYSFLYTCLMITDAQLWDLKLLTLHEFPVQRLKPLFSYIYSPNTQ